MELKRNVSMLLRHPQALPPILSNMKRSVTVHRDYARDDGYSGNPKGISLTVTKRCNLNCSMCHYAHSAREDIRLNESKRGEPSSVDLELVGRLVRGWRGPKPYIALTGGEPTLHRQLLDIVRVVKDADFVCMLVSNGARLSEMAEEIVAAGIDVVSLSIDGSRETHDRIRGVPGTYDKAVAAMRAVVDARERRKWGRPLVFINSAMSNASVEELHDLVNLANDVEASGINFQHLWLQTETMVCAHNDLVPELAMQEVYDLDIEARVDDVDRLVDTLGYLKKKHRFVNVFPALDGQGIKTYYDRPEAFVSSRPTRCSWLYATIQPDGRVTQCKEHVMGNLADSSFDEIWNGESFQEFRRVARKHERFPICARCCHYFKDW
ncbi:MAG: radical SAM protein [Coriobacteriia bacterium]|nr:radical SAM protein [Coriobacteriia bacterium]